MKKYRVHQIFQDEEKKQALIKDIAGSELVFICSPVYVHSLPYPLVSLMEYFSEETGKGFWKNKKMMVVGFLFYLSRGLDTGSQLAINDIDLLSLNDGVYRGKYNVGRWSNEVEVEIKDHRIRQITLLKDVRFSRPEVINELFDRIINKQTLQVEVVTGASVTSKAYLKSMEQALKQ